MPETSNPRPALQFQNHRLIITRRRILYFLEKNRFKNIILENDLNKYEASSVIAILDLLPF